MNIEKIAEIDYQLKKNYGITSIINIENMIFFDLQNNAIQHFKDSAKALSQIQIMDHKTNELWNEILGKQVRTTVNKIKELKEQN